MLPAARSPLPALATAASWWALVLAGCSDHMKLDSSMEGKLETVIRADGPLQLQVQMQGPTIRYEGTYISDELLEYVKIGKSTDEWIVAVFGEPDARSVLKDGSEVWRWTYRPIEQQGSVVELFSKSEKDPKLATRTVFILLRAGVVTEKWKG